MKRVRRMYGEGTWIGVPLKTGGLAAGLVARGKSKVLLGYFFGPRMDHVPILDEVRHYKAEDAILVSRFGDLDLWNGTWPIIGKAEPWDRGAWPMPRFVQGPELTGYTTVYYVDEDDPANVVHRERVGPEVTGPKSGVLGAGAVIIVLENLLPPLDGGVSSTGN